MKKIYQEYDPYDNEYAPLFEKYILNKLTEDEYDRVTEEFNKKVRRVVS